MKKLLPLLGLLLLSYSFCAAQGGGGNGGSGSGGSGSGYHGGNGHGPNANNNAMQQLKAQLANGMAIPPWLNQRVLLKTFQTTTHFGLSLQSLRNQFNAGNLTVTYVQTSPPSLTFRVRYNGVDIMVVIDDL